MLPGAGGGHSDPWAAGVPSERVQTSCAVSWDPRLAHSRPGLSVVTPAARLDVTVSIGLAACNSAHETIERVAGAADAALYRAKESGRNRVEIDGTR